MKKLIALFAIAFASISIAYAQFGIVGGFTSSSTTVNTQDFKENLNNISLYHVGLTYKLDLGLGLAIQPSLTYEMKGATLNENMTGSDVIEVGKSVDIKSGFAEFGLDLQWGPDLVAFRPFVFASPFIGVMVYNPDDQTTAEAGVAGQTQSVDASAFVDWAKDAKNRLEYGFGIGAGVDLLRFVQLKAQYFMNLGQLYDADGKATNIKETVTGINLKDFGNYSGIKVSLSILLF